MRGAGDAHLWSSTTTIPKGLAGPDTAALRNFFDLSTTQTMIILINEFRIQKLLLAHVRNPRRLVALVGKANVCDKRTYPSSMKWAYTLL